MLEIFYLCGKYKIFIYEQTFSTLLVFGVIIVFLDENSLIQRAKHREEIRELNEEIAKYRKQFEEDTRKLKELTDNPEALEKIAREKYLMKKPNEDIFIFEE